MDRTEQYIFAILVIVFIIICVARSRNDTREGLHCGCARRDAAMYAWDPQAKLKPCPTRFSGQMPYRHPQQACASPMYNPFWPPYGSARAYIGSSTPIDAPISRMIGDHVPLE